MSLYTESGKQQRQYFDITGCQLPVILGCMVVAGGMMVDALRRSRKTENPQGPKQNPPSK